MERNKGGLGQGPSKWEKTDRKKKIYSLSLSTAEKHRIEHIELQRITLLSFWKGENNSSVNMYRQ